MDSNRAGIVYQNQGLVVLLVSKVESNTCKSGSICTFTGSVQPVAIVICGAVEEKAFDMHANNLSLEKLRSECHELDHLMSLV